MGRILTITDPLGNDFQLFYDTLNNLIHVIDPKDNNYYLDYEGYHLVKIRDPKQGHIDLYYNAYDQLSRFEDANSHPTIFDYNGTTGDLTTVTNPMLVGGNCCPVSQLIKAIIIRGVQ